MNEIKSVRVRSKDGVDIKVTLYKSGNRRKIEGKSNGLPTWGLSEYGGNRYQNYTDDQIIDDFIEVNRKSSQISDIEYYSIIQDPWSDNPPSYRSFGYDPYYLNNGTSIYIYWLDDDNVGAGGKAWSDENGNELNIKSGLTQSTKGLITKTVTITPPSDSGDKSLIVKDSTISSEYVTGDKFSGTTSDLDIINQVISYWKIKVPNYDIELCSPSNTFCNLITYKSPVQELTPEEEPPQKTEESEQGKDKIKLSVVIPKDLELKVKEDLNELKVYVGEPPLSPSDFVFQDDFDNLEELDPEFYESSFSAEEESPESIPEVPSSSNSNPESSSESEFKPGTSTPGERVTLPETYSHSDAQGFNLLNSQWIGNIIVSAKSHIKTPTYDVSGTDKGNLGCASAVSIIFYRAFGVHMKTGSAVREKPTSIGHFGSKGTAELSGWFEAAPNLYQKIPWESAQPGDIMNTSRNFSTGQAGHIGIVIDVKDSDGSWAIVSNSSKGFAGGGGGAVKQNYSVKKWSSVTKRNPSKTFAFRYIGPSLATQA